MQQATCSFPILLNRGFVNPANGTMASYAGYGVPGLPVTVACLVGPAQCTHGVWADASGNIIIGDTGNQLVRAIDPTTQSIRSFAGGGNGGDTGPATSGILPETAPPQWTTTAMFISQTPLTIALKDHCWRRHYHGSWYRNRDLLWRWRTRDQRSPAAPPRAWLSTRSGNRLYRRASRKPRRP